MGKRRILAVVLSGTMLLSMMAGTGVNAEETATEAPAAAEATWDTTKEDTITLSVINNFYTAGEKKLAEEYMALHPETKVVVDVVSDNEAYKTKMITSLSEDRSNAPDIVHGNFVGMALTGNSMDLAVDKGYLYDMTEMLDEENPYNGGKVRDAFEEEDLTMVLSNSGGKYMTYLPFDKIGFAVFYNKDIFEEQGLEVPTSYETLVETCEKLKEAGYDVPLSAGMESFRLADSLADALYREKEGEFLVQPGDALWNEETMSANRDFQFDESNLTCDLFTVFSLERQTKYALENGIDTEENRKMWTEFQKVAQYFPQNWTGSDSTQAITDFESQISPMLYQASFNAGQILNDISQLPDDMKFDYATFQISSFDNPPEGFQKELRSYYTFGNIMSIIQKDDEDHMARVKDFYKFWYSKDGATTCYEETLANGNFVQGPCVVKGVELSEDLNELLEGFKANPSKEWQGLTGLQAVNQQDLPKWNDMVLKFSFGETDIDTFMQTLDEIYLNYYNQAAESAGFDLDPTTLDEVKE